MKNFRNIGSANLLSATMLASPSLSDQKIIPGIFQRALQQFFPLFRTSLINSTLGQNRGLAWLLLVVKHLQLLSIGFLPHLQKFWPHQLIRLWIVPILSWINPGLTLIKTLHPQNFETLKLCLSLFFSLFVLIFLTKYFFAWDSSHDDLAKKSKNGVKKLLIFLFIELLPIPYSTIFLVSLSCKMQNMRTSGTIYYKCCTRDFSFGDPFQVFYLVQFAVFVLAVFNLKRMNFDSMTDSTKFGTKRGNHSGAVSYLITTICTALVLTSEYNPQLSATFHMIGIVGNFWINAKSKEYICIRYKLAIISVNSIGVWLSTFLALSIINERIIPELPLLFSLSLIPLVLNLSLSVAGTDSPTSYLDNLQISSVDNGSECAIKLERLVWMFLLSRKGSHEAARISFDGFFETFIKSNNSKLKGMRSYSQELEMPEESQRLLLRTNTLRAATKTTGMLKSSATVQFKEFVMHEYLRVLKKFYDCAELRLSFLTFLLEHTEYRKLALYNISLLEAQMTLTLEQKIQIFRLRILIDEKQTERIQGAKNQDQLNKTGGGAGSALQSEAKNFLSEITLLKLNSQMNSQMESACLIYKDFWKELRDDSPSITKIEAHLLKSFQAFESVEHAWKENGLLDCLNLTAKRNYGIFVTQILERGKSGLGLIRDYYQNFKQVRKLDQTLRDFEIKDGKIRSFVDPLILMKKDAKGDLRIFNCNLEFCKKVGLPKFQLMNSLITKFLSSKSAKFFRQMLSKLAKLKSLNQKSYLKSYSTTLRLASGCICFYTVELKVCKMNEIEDILVVRINPKPVMMTKAEILVDESLNIWGNNSQCYNLLGLRCVRMSDLKVKSLDQILPYLKNIYKKNNEDLDLMVGKPPQEIVYRPKKDHSWRRSKSFKNLTKTSTSIFKNNRFDAERTLRFSVNTMDDTGLYLIQLWPSKAIDKQTQKANFSSQLKYSKIMNSETQESISGSSRRRKRVYDFQFKLDSNFNFVAKVNHFNPSKTNTGTLMTPNEVKTNDKTAPPFGMTSEPRLFIPQNDHHMNANLNQFNNNSEEIKVRRGIRRLMTTLGVERKNSNESSSQIIDLVGLTDQGTGDPNVDRAKDLLKTYVNMMASQEVKFIKYGEGIVTRRLVDGVLRDVYDDEDDVDSLEDSMGSDSSSIFKKRYINLSANNLGSSSSSVSGKWSQHRVQKISQTIPKRITPVRCFWAFTVLYTLVCAVLFLYYSMIDNQDLESASELVSLEKNGIMMSVGLQAILGRITDISLINSGVNLLYGASYSNETEKYKREGVEYLQLWSKKVVDFHLKFNGFDATLPCLQKLNQSRFKENVRLKTSSQFRNYSIKLAMEQVMAVSHNLAARAALNTSVVTFEDPDVDFLRFNIVNGVHQTVYSLVMMSKTIREQLFLRQDPKVERRLLQLLGISLVVFAVSYLMICVALSVRQRAVESFYGFDDIYVVDMGKRCGEFASFIRQQKEVRADGGDEENEEASNQEHLKELEDAFLDQNGLNNLMINKRKNQQKPENKEKAAFFNLRRKRRRGTLYRVLGLWELFLVLALQINFLLNLNSYFGQTRAITTTTGASELIFALNGVTILPYASRNTLMTAMIDPKSKTREVPVMGILAAYEKLQNQRIMELSNYTFAFGYHQEKISEGIKQLFESDLCSIYLKYKKFTPSEFKPNCQTFMRGNMAKNLDISYTRIKTKLTHLVKSGLDKYPYKNQCQKFEGMDTKKSVRICLLASPEYRNFTDAVRRFLYPLTSQQVQKVQEWLNNELREFKIKNNQYGVVYLGFLVFSVVILILISNSFNDKIRKVCWMMGYQKSYMIAGNKRMRLFLSYWDSL